MDLQQKLAQKAQDFQSCLMEQRQHTEALKEENEGLRRLQAQMEGQSQRHQEEM